MRSSFGRVLWCLWFSCTLCAGANYSYAQAKSLHSSRFGDIAISHSSEAPKEFAILFATGDVEEPRLESLVRTLVQSSYAVAKIDGDHYLAVLQRENGNCHTVGDDFPRLARTVQAQTGVPEYKTPLVIGVGRGAALAYLSAVEARETIRAVVTVDMCRDLPIPSAACSESAELEDDSDNVVFRPPGNLSLPVLNIATHAPGACTLPSGFFSHARSLVSYPRIDAGLAQSIAEGVETLFSVPTPAASPTPAPTPALGALPVLEVRSKETRADYFVLYLSGEDGWSALDRAVASTFAERGIGVVGLDSLHYFWRNKTPEQMAADLARIVDHYFSFWKKSGVVVVGRSLGASTAPFAINRLEQKTYDSIHGLVAINPVSTAKFVVKPADWLDLDDPDAGLDVLTEISGLAHRSFGCVSAAEEGQASICPKLGATGAKTVELPGGSDFGGDFSRVSETIFKLVTSFGKQAK